MLRDFHFGGYPYHLTGRLASPSWMRHLCSMNLSAELTVSKTLQALILTPNLINLRLDKMVGEHEVIHRPRISDPNFLPLVSFPKLAHLYVGISATLAPLRVLLDRLCIPPACSMVISAHSIQVEEIARKKILAPIIHAISTCARSHFAYHIPHRVRLTIKKRYFMFETATYSDNPTFKLWLELPPRPVFPTHTLTMLLNHLSLPGLSQATIFYTRVNGVNIHAADSGA
ncbi:hypothetical protein HYPSUDRAFT_670305 [Hypholoma sublateritium FD-334 SS-4]|uniref:F-box domain-containing protein n=1 Tax=Hypholoma sublateritium (strain FD-334 SS-4) TaxID=945553 RepID=A0A0D2N7R4_HYPSF|nr:hypothetical protein HYPSUDRAFT_677274 [Hypholoma sublateritium FD-334 SS-4]KJA12858.1 hypothetical protein HYPSUDRAFT_670305 [Hypholoma sublateritium FD-334 SS-4]